MATSTAKVESITNDLAEQGKEFIQESEKVVLKLVEAGTGVLRDLSPEWQAKFKAFDPSDFVTATADTAVKFVELSQQYAIRVLTTVFGKDAA